MDPKLEVDLFDHLDTVFTPVFKTQYGRAYCMDSRELMKAIPDESIDLIVTSPPYALVKKKEYGNEEADTYIPWFMEFAKEFKRILKTKGSLVINIGGAYERGRPTRSLYHFELLIRLVRDLGFFLAQEFYWFNPAKMPAPAEWVTIRRVRVRDSVEPIWWLSKDPHPYADNRKVLRQYSKAMHELLEKGYNSGPRPSGHDVSTEWGRDNGGAIPPNIFEVEHVGEEYDLWPDFVTTNLLRIANTASNDRYLRLCKEHGIKPHPARFPIDIPQFFIRFLTEPGAVVFDPFAGSGTTGAAAQSEGRYWITCDIDLDYVRSSAFRFPELTPEKPTADHSQMKLF